MQIKMQTLNSTVANESTFTRLCAHSAQVQGDLRRNIQAGSAVESAMAGNFRCYGSRLLPLSAVLHGPEHRRRHGQQSRQPV